MKIITKIFPGLIAFFVLSARLYSQSLSFGHLSIEQGLSQNSVNCIVQDYKGFIWLGTQDGLNKYDGYNFSVYRNDPLDSTSLSNGWVTSAADDGQNHLWVGTLGGGINVLDRTTGKFLAFQYDPSDPASLSNNKIRVVYNDRQGTLWIATDGGLNRWNKEKKNFTRYLHDPADVNSLSYDHVSAIYEDRAGVLWIGTYGGGLDEFDRNRKNFIRYGNRINDPHSLSDDRVTGISEDADGELWIGTQDGLNHLDPVKRTFTVYRHRRRDPASLSHNGVSRIFKDRSGKLWVGTYGGGLDLLDHRKGTFIPYRNSSVDSKSLSNDFIMSLFEDSAGTLWIGTEGGGVNTFNPFKDKFPHYKNDPLSENSSSHNNVFSILEDGSGRLWIGTYGSGLYQFDRRTGRTVHYESQANRPEGLTDNLVFAVTEDRAGMIWIATDGGGLDQFDPVKHSFRHYKNQRAQPNSLGDNYVRLVYQDRAGVLWIGLDHAGLDAFDPATGTFSHYRNQPNDPLSLANDRIRAIVEDRSGTLWIGTYGSGLDKFDRTRGTFAHHRNEHNNPNSLSMNDIWSVREDAAGTLWIGTGGGGLNKFNPQTETFEQIRQKDGLPNGFIYGILEDDENNLWISSNKGLTKFNPKLMQFRNYDIQDGLQSNEFNYNAYFKNGKGEMFFGGINGFNAFYPDRIKDNPYIPPVYFTGFKKFDKEKPLGQPMSEIRKVELSHEDYVFSFEMAALNYVLPEKNRYAYYLEGFNEDWIDLGTEHDLTFTNLDPGKYVLHVKASNNDGIWNENGASITLVIRPPFWSTWWFRLFVGASLAGLAFVVYRRRVRHIVEQNLRLERLVAERTRELERGKSELERSGLQLEKTVSIVQSINSEIELSDLLNSILRKMQMITNVKTASVLVMDAATEKFRFKACLGLDFNDLEGITLTREEAESRYLQNSEKIAEDIFAVSHITGRTAQAKFDHLAPLESLLVLCIRGEQAIEGYLLFDNIEFAELDKQDILLLENLKEHIRWAIVKARILNDFKTLNEKKNEYLGIVAHDLRNPLSTIVGYTDLLIADLANEQFDREQGIQDLNQIARVSRHMTRFIAELLDISAIESGKVKMNMHSLNLMSIVAESEMLHTRAAQQKNIQLVIERQENLPPVNMDAAKISSVLDNLLSNAIKYTYPGGRVRVRFEATDREVITHVEDTGQGLTEEDLQKVFTTFKKLSAKPTGDETSTGLGLAIVKKIVELHGGHVTVKSEKEKGSTFSFSLPQDKN